MKDFIVGRIKSIKFALRGMFLLLKTEHAIITQAFIGGVSIILGLFFNISRYEWIIQLFLIGFVLSIEGLNTTVEKICDFIHPDFNDKIGFIKDIAAGAVSFAALTSIIIGIIIYYPYILSLF